MTEPERRVLVALVRRGGCSRTELERHTRLGGPTLDHSLAKLERMGRITVVRDRYRTTGAGRTALDAESLR